MCFSGVKSQMRTGQARIYMSHTLKGGLSRGFYTELVTSIGVTKGDTRSLDYGSCDVLLCWRQS